jgi:hypothetical protein
MKCETCKWWGDLSWEEEFLKRRGFPPMRDCDHPDPHFLPYGEGILQEGICTRPDFGCIQHEPK